MIIKSFELTKIDLKKNQFFLLYGENEGHKKQVIEESFKKFYTNNIYLYEENEILQNEGVFFNNILSKSLIAFIFSIIGIIIGSLNTLRYSINLAP